MIKINFQTNCQWFINLKYYTLICLPNCIPLSNSKHSPPKPLLMLILCLCLAKMVNKYFIWKPQILFIPLKCRIFLRKITREMEDFTVREIIGIRNWRLLCLLILKLDSFMWTSTKLTVLMPKLIWDIFQSTR